LSRTGCPVILRDRAILVRKTSGAVEGKMLTFLTREGGKAHLYYRLYPRRMRREFFDPLQAGELLYSPASDSAPGKLDSFHCEEAWPSVRSDLDRLVHGLHFAELAVLFTGEGESAADVFDLLESFLHRLGEGADPEALRIVYELRLLAAAGFAPSLERCYSCHLPVDAGAALFSPRGGGMICEKCRPGRKEAASRLSAGALAALKKALIIAADHAGRLRMGAHLKTELTLVVDELVTLALEGKPSSAPVLKALGRKPVR